MVLGQFPAAALLFRKNYLKQGDPVVEEFRSLDELWKRVPPLLPEDSGYDPNRDAGITARRTTRTCAADALAFLAGPVKVHFDVKPAPPHVNGAARLVDHEKKIVRSNTGEIAFDFGRGVCKIDAPAAAGATGFLKKFGVVETKSVTIDSQNDYATVLIVSQDGQPLVKSRNVLVQVGTRARPTRWVEREATFKGDDGKQTFHGKQVVSTGTMPWAVEETRVKLAIRNPALRTAIPLDSSGNARGSLKLTLSGGVSQIELPRDALYVVLKADGP